MKKSPLLRLILSPATSENWVPSEMGPLTGLQQLDLSKCSSLKELPSWMGQLTGLQQLDLSFCESLTELPSWMGQLTGLQQLNLSQCSSLKELPSWMGQLTGLQQLNLYRCSSLTELPSWMGQLTGLQQLNLSGCSSLKELPSWMGKLTGLQQLNLCGCSSLKELPSWMGKLTGLQQLNLSGCSSLTELPSWMGQLTGLQQLDLLGCLWLTELPSWMGQLTGLQQLNLSGCSSLTELPSWMGQLTGLQQLNLCGWKSVTELPSWMGQLTGLQQLDLSWCDSLKELPSWMGQLTGLQQLNLTGCSSLTELPSWMGQLTGLQQLNLSGCSSLKELPSGMGQLTGLQQLNLSECKSLPELSSWMGQLTGLQQLNLSECSSLKELPSWMGQLTGLQLLSLARCKSLEELPSWMGQLTGLQQLNLSECSSLKELPSWMGQLTGLQQLDLSQCSSLKELPSWMGQLTGLQQLSLSGSNSLKELPSWMGQLTGLQQLNLFVWKSVTELPSWMGQLTGLQQLKLSKCKSLKELPSWMGQLTGLQQLDLSQCSSLKELPSWMGQLTGLQQLNLSFCASLKELSSWMGQLTGLQQLDLSWCESLTELPSWMGQLTGLQQLNLSGCSSLKELPSWMGQLTGLQRLDLSGCRRLHTPPRDVVTRGTGAVLQYLRDLGEGNAPCHLLKIVLVGDERAGKSSLIESLMRSKPSPRRQEDRTVGIDIHRWRPSTYSGVKIVEGVTEGDNKFEKPVPFAVGSSRLESPVVAQVFDAAGHRIYHASHRIFMSRDALYVHVVRYNANADKAFASISKWMDLVQTASPGCVMVIVLSCIDHFDGDLEEYVCKLKQSVQNATDEALHELDREMRKLENSVESKMASKEWTSRREERDSALRELESTLITSWHRPVKWKAAGNTVMAQLDQNHQAMAKMEMETAAQDHAGFDIDVERLAHLREVRTHRQRVVFCGGVSCRTGAGLDDFHAALVDIMSTTEVFPHLGMKVPLTYTTLERCVRPREQLTSKSHSPTLEGTAPEGVEESTAAPADWEMACAAHHQKKSLEYGDRWARLEQLCSQDVVKLVDLKEAALQCGIVSDELESALHFLHASGSLLYYRSRPGVGEDAVLQEHVFTHPSWIIDAVKCFIHEPEADDQNDEFRELITRVEETDGEALLQYRETGILSDHLLCRLWACFAQQGSRTRQPEFAQNHTALISLFCSLRLMRKTETEDSLAEDSVAYVVPAMFPDRPLPDALIEPVWLPPKAHGADAFMRRQYTGVGYVPHGFLGELQVAWMCEEYIDSCNHFAAPEDALASSLGSHLQVSYGSKTEQVEENVVVSLWQSSKACSDGTQVVESKLCVMGWVSLLKDQGCRSGKTEWGLFKLVTACIEEKLAKTRCALLSGTVSIPWVDREDGDSVSEVSLAACLRQQRRGKHVVLVGTKNVDLDELLPRVRVIEAQSAKRGRESDSDHLTNAKHPKIQDAGDAGGRNEGHAARTVRVEVVVDESCRKRKASTMEAAQKPRVLAFFAQERTDPLDTTREAQALTRKLSVSKIFEFDPHPRPRFEDFHEALMCSQQDNVQVVHLAGHADTKEGFSFVKDDGGISSEKIDPEKIAAALCPRSASKGGTVECVVLNACSTEAMAKMLRDKGIKHVVCWRGKVRDGAAIAFSEAFYNSLQHGTGHSCLTIPDKAFEAAFADGRVALSMWKDRAAKGSAVRVRNSVTNEALDVVVLLSVLGDDLGDDKAQTGPDGGVGASRQHDVVQEQGQSPGSVQPAPGRPNRPHGSIEMDGESVDADEVVGATVEIDDDDEVVVLDDDDDDAEACVVVEDGAGGSGVVDDEIEGGLLSSADTRSVTNRKGQKECEAFQALGVKMEYPAGSSIEKGIKMYAKGMIAGGQLARYGLEEDPNNVDRRTGRQHLRLTLAALEFMFKAHELPAGVPLRGYSDLFGAAGVVVEWAKRCKSRGRFWAVANLKGSLQIREEEARSRGGGDAGHQHMMVAIRECVQAIEGMD